MGLGFIVSDNTEVKAQWSYSGFYYFRKMVALSIGIDIEEMQGFRKRHPDDPEFIKLGWKSWDEVKHPLKSFLNHSDSEGVLTSKECKNIYPALESIIRNWEVGFLVSEHDFHSGLNLIESMKYCAENNQDLIFC